MVSNGKFIEVMIVLGVQPKGHEWQSFPPFLAHDQKSKLLECGSKVVGCTGEIEHDGTIAVLAKTNHLVVLTNYLGGAFGEVEGERGLVGPKVVDIEDQFFRKVFGRTPDDPADTGINLQDDKSSLPIQSGS